MLIMNIQLELHTTGRKLVNLRILLVRMVRLTRAAMLGSGPKNYILLINGLLVAVRSSS